MIVIRAFSSFLALLCATIPCIAVECEGRQCKSFCAPAQIGGNNGKCVYEALNTCTWNVLLCPQISNHSSI
jgi:hypothetical protein